MLNDLAHALGGIWVFAANAAVEVGVDAVDVFAGVELFQKILNMGGVTAVIERRHVNGVCSSFSMIFVISLRIC